MFLGISWQIKKLIKQKGKQPKKEQVNQNRFRKSQMVKTHGVEKDTGSFILLTMLSIVFLLYLDFSFYW